MYFRITAGSLFLALALARIHVLQNSCRKQTNKFPCFFFPPFFPFAGINLTAVKIKIAASGSQPQSGFVFPSTPSLTATREDLRDSPSRHPNKSVPHGDRLIRGSEDGPQEGRGEGRECNSQQSFFQCIEFEGMIFVIVRVGNRW